MTHPPFTAAVITDGSSPSPLQVATIDVTAAAAAHLRHLTGTHFLRQLQQTVGTGSSPSVGEGSTATDDTASTTDVDDYYFAQEGSDLDCDNGELRVTTTSEGSTRTECQSLSELSGGVIAAIVIASLIVIGVCCVLPVLCFCGCATCCYHSSKHKGPPPPPIVGGPAGVVSGVPAPPPYQTPDELAAAEAQRKQQGYAPQPDGHAQY